MGRAASLGGCLAHGPAGKVRVFPRRTSCCSCDGEGGREPSHSGLPLSFDAPGKGTCAYWAWPVICGSLWSHLEAVEWQTPRGLTWEDRLVAARSLFALYPEASHMHLCLPHGTWGGCPWPFEAAGERMVPQPGGTGAWRLQVVHLSRKHA